MPSISIVVPIFNGSRYLPYFFDSLAAAAPPAAEIILVDDASNDPVFDTVPIDFPFRSVKKIRLDQNQGYSAAVNNGFARSTGEIIIQLNTDLILDRHAITSLLQIIEDRARVGIVGSKQVLPTTGLVRHIGMAFGNKSRRHIYSGLSADHPLCCKTRSMQMVSGATAAMSRTVLNDVGPLDDEYYNTLENFDHCIKATQSGYLNFTCAESVVYHWVGQSSPARYARTNEGEAHFWSKWVSAWSTDLHVFVAEALESLFDRHCDLQSYPVNIIALSQSGDQEILLDCVQRFFPNADPRILRHGPLKYSGSKIWLPMELPHWKMASPAPMIYLVDRIGDLSENHMWFSNRHRIVKSDLILDIRACAVTSQELLSLYGEGAV